MDMKLFRVAYLRNGSHVHFFQGIGTVCWKNHKKVDWKGYLAGAGLIGFFTLAAHLILKSQGL